MTMTDEERRSIRSLNLWQKIAAIYGEVDAVKKTGKNLEQKYSYTEQSAVVAALRNLLAMYGVTIIQSVASRPEFVDIVSKHGAKGWLVRVEYDFTLRNADKPEEKEVARWYAEASDYGDKSLNKASTSANKYFLMKTFQISDVDSDDPDQKSHEIEPGQRMSPKSGGASPRTPIPGQNQTQPQGHESAGEVTEDLASLHSAHKLLNASFPAKPEKDGRRDDGSTFHTVVQLKKYREEMRQSLITAVMLNVEGDEIDPDISVKDLCKLAEEIAFTADATPTDDTELKAVGDDLDGKKPAPPENPFSKKKGAK